MSSVSRDSTDVGDPGEVITLVERLPMMQLHKDKLASLI